MFRFLLPIFLVFLVGVGCSSGEKKKRFATVGEEKIVPKDDGTVEVINTKTLDEHLQQERALRVRAEEERDYWKRKVKELEKENDQLRVRMGVKAKNKKRMPKKFDEKGNVVEWDRDKDPSNIDDEIKKSKASE